MQTDRINSESGNKERRKGCLGYGLTAEVEEVGLKGIDSPQINHHLKLFLNNMKYKF